MNNPILNEAGWYLDEYDGPKFWAHVNFRGGKPYVEDPLSRLGADAGECWTWTGWTGGVPTHQYGRFKLFGIPMQAHRIGLLEFGGKIADDQVADHLCRNTLCVRHNHLEAVTQVENMARGAWAGRTHCEHGHEYTEENIRIVARGESATRLCRMCLSVRRREYYLASKAKSA